MTVDRVYKGLAHVRPRPEAGFEPGVVGAYVNVLVLGQDGAQLKAVVSEAMDVHDCDLLDVELEPLEEALDGNTEPEAWREIAGELSQTQASVVRGNLPVVFE